MQMMGTNTGNTLFVGDQLFTDVYGACLLYTSIRGICCLKTGIPKVSEHIRVRSLVGNFLEHARIFYFRNGGEEEFYMGSADWMPRNLDKRVEITFPVEDQRLKEEMCIRDRSSAG